jgi:hypothetical protein
MKEARTLKKFVFPFQNNGQKSRAPGRQCDNTMNGVAHHYWVLGSERASCDLAGAQNFEKLLDFWKVCAPVYCNILSETRNIHQ